MAFVVLISGHVIEVAETRQQVVTALAAAGAQSATGTVAGAPMTFRSSGILAVAESRDQVTDIVDPLPAVAATPPEPEAPVEPPVPVEPAPTEPTTPVALTAQTPQAEVDSEVPVESTIDPPMEQQPARRATVGEPEPEED